MMSRSSVHMRTSVEQWREAAAIPGLREADHVMHKREDERMMAAYRRVEFVIALKAKGVREEKVG